MPINKEKNVRLTFTTEKEVLEQIKELQRESSVFNRSEVIRQLVNRGLQSTLKDGQAI